MIYDSTRLGTVIALWLLAALFGSLGWGVKWGTAEGWVWLGMLIRLVALIFMAWALMTSLDWSWHHSAERVREMGSARMKPSLDLAHALKGLSSSQTDLVRRFATVSIEMVLNEAAPLFLVRCVDGELVDWGLVEEFFQGCLREDLVKEGKLLPERDFQDWRKAQSITRTIIANGWAKPARGNQSAELTRPLDWVAERFGIEVK